MAEFFKVEFVVRGYNVYKDVWSAAVGITLPCQQERFLFERSIWPIANLIKILNGRKYSIFCCKFSYPCLLICRKFLILALHRRPFFHSGFYHWLYIIINIINLLGQYGLYQKSAWAWQNSITITKTIFFHVLVNFEILTLLMPKVNITRVKFSWMTINSWNLWKFPPKNSLYGSLQRFLIDILLSKVIPGIPNWC